MLHASREYQKHLQCLPETGRRRGALSRPGKTPESKLQQTPWRSETAVPLGSGRDGAGAAAFVGTETGRERVLV